MAESSNTWLPSLIVPTPEAGVELAVKPAHMSVKLTQPSDAAHGELRPKYDRDVAALIASSHVIAVRFHMVAAANGGWRT